jgi:DNA-binding response OmpR family regulator
MNVLIAEDDALTRLMLQRAVEHQGMRVWWPRMAWKRGSCSRPTQWTSSSATG